jgi:DNA-binding PadR family transcriptional regulator
MRKRQVGAMSKRGGGYLSGLIAGTLIGAGLAYFLTQTEEGKRIKKDLTTKGKRALDDLAETIVDFEKKGEEFKKKAKKLQGELEQKTKDVKKEVVKEAQEQLAQVEELKKRGRQITKRSFIKNGKKLT